MLGVRQGEPLKVWLINDLLNYINRTAFAHAMHTHGHHFRAVDDSGEGFKPNWLDTVIVDRDRSVRTAFVADNPGKWMLHCHMTAGMAAWFRMNDGA